MKAKQVQYTNKAFTGYSNNHGPVIGFFRTKEYQIGWTLHDLSDFDKSWFESQGVNTDNVYRIESANNNTSIVKFTEKHGSLYFFDNDYYETTDRIKFQDDAVRTTTVILKTI